MDIFPIIRMNDLKPFLAKSFFNRQPGDFRPGFVDKDTFAFSIIEEDSNRGQGRQGAKMLLT